MQRQALHLPAERVICPSSIAPSRASSDIADAMRSAIGVIEPLERRPADAPQRQDREHGAGQIDAMNLRLRDAAAADRARPTAAATMPGPSRAARPAR